VRILEGKWKGRDLVSPSGRVRPTTEELRAVWMKVIEADLPGARCIDLFAGSGAVGLEALSRGARSCDFVENNPSAMHALKANVAKLKAREQVRIFDRDAIPFVNRITQIGYDIAFVDPPYDSLKLDRVLQRWMVQPFSRVLCLEHSAAHALPHSGSTQYTAGDSLLTIFRAEVS
jgi:16S rRNA (guanine966-N2)-methyltransferase